MPLSWNEIKSRAAAFSKEWENDFNEDAEGNILVEQKSRGKSLDKAFTQAKDYFPGLTGKHR